MHVLLCHAQDVQQAHLMIGALQNAEIDARIKSKGRADVMTEAVLGFGPPPWIEVPEEQLELARQVLADLHRPADE